MDNNKELASNAQEVEKTIVVNDLIKEEIPQESNVEKTKAFVAQDIEMMDNDDYEYEYYTPHYLRNALILGLCSFLIAGIVTFIVCKEKMTTQAQAYYESAGYMLTKDATATEDDIYNGKTAYASGNKLTGKFEDIDLSLADASVEDVLKGYTFYNASGMKKGTIKGYSGVTNFSILTTSQTIKCGGRYLPEPIFIRVDNNLKPENIKAGVQILDVVGTYTGE